MKQFRKILVGLDLTPAGDAVSQGSRRAAQQGEWLARQSGAALTFLHSTWADLYEESDLLRHGLSAEGAQALESLVGDYRESGLPVEFVETDERVWIDMVRRCNAGANDLVIVARRNSPGAATLGSTSRRLLRKCPAPVWVVREDSPLLQSRVLAATDLTAVGDRAVELGASLAHLYDGHLDVLHAWQVPLDVQMSDSFAPDAAATVKQRLQSEAEDHIRAHLASLPYEVDSALHVGRDAPSRAILQGIEKLESETLVMGTVSRSGVAGLLVGNTAERILDRVPCSMLTIKPEDFVSPVN